MTSSPAMQSPGRAAAIARIALAVGVAGILAGTFLPWVASGRARRNVYQLAGLADRLGAAGSLPLGLAFVIPLVVAVPALLIAVGWARTAAATGLAVALLTGAGGVIALTAEPGNLIAIDAVGPAVMTISAALLLVASLGTIRWSANGPARVEGTEG